ncbi:MAG: hypothetical protein AAFV53_04955 [Myxococcota bacterium]
MTTSQQDRTWRLGRGLVLLAALIYGVLPGIIDFFTPQHLGDPNWVGHQRFHLIWQIFLILYLGVASLWYAWRADSPKRFDLIQRSASYGLIVLIAFFTSGALAIPMGAAFGEPDEVLLGVPFPVIHFSIASLVLLAGYLLCRRANLGADT